MLAGTYMVPIQLGWQTIRTWRGLILGFIIGGFGLGCLIFNSVAAHIVNPLNLKEVLISEDPLRYGFPEEVAARVPELFRRFALYYSIIVVASVVLIQDRPLKPHRNVDDYRRIESLTS